MTLVVLDASAVASWFVPGQETASSDLLLGQVSAMRFVAPYVFPAECRNLLLKAQRRGAMDEADIRKALDFLHAMDLGIQPSPDRAGQDHALTLALREGLSFYDALYLKVALETSAGLASRDGALLEAGTRCGLTIIDLRK